jgi:hypothetical protein
MDVRVLRSQFVPAPAMGPKVNGRDPRLSRARISSTGFEQAYVADVDVVIRRHLDEPRIDGSASELLTRPYNRDRVSEFRYGAVTVGSVDLDPHSHPIDRWPLAAAHLDVRRAGRSPAPLHAWGQSKPGSARAALTIRSSAQTPHGPAPTTLDPQQSVAPCGQSASPRAPVPTHLTSLRQSNPQLWFIGAAYPGG